MPRFPWVYGNLLKERIAKGGVRCWLVNTGWTGGKYGTGSRMPIKATRALLNAALDGSLNEVEFRTDPNFGVEVPVRVPGVDPKILNPRETWATKPTMIPPRQAGNPGHRNSPSRRPCRSRGAGRRPRVGRGRRKRNIPGEGTTPTPPPRRPDYSEPSKGAAGVGALLFAIQDTTRRHEPNFGRETRRSEGRQPASSPHPPQSEGPQAHMPTEADRRTRRRNSPRTGTFPPHPPRQRKRMRPEQRHGGLSRTSTG